MLVLVGTLAVDWQEGGEVSGCRAHRSASTEMTGTGCFRRKPCVDLVGNDDGDAFERRFPS